MVRLFHLGLRPPETLAVRMALFVQKKGDTGTNMATRWCLRTLVAPCIPLEITVVKCDLKALYSPES